MTNKDFNKVIITGRPKSSPEVKTTLSGITVINFTLISEGSKSREYVDVTVWGELAEKVYKDITPTRRIMVEGTLHRTAAGDEKYGKLEITANRVFDMGDANE